MRRPTHPLAASSAFIVLDGTSVRSAAPTARRINHHMTGTRPTHVYFGM